MASVGSDGSFALAEDDGSSDSVFSGAGGSPRSPVVASGNVLMGNGGTGVAKIVDGTVTGVLGPTGQTLVELVNGTTVVLNGDGASLGDVVSIDLGGSRVVGGTSSLVGLNVSTTGSATKAGPTVTTTASGAVRTGTGSLLSTPSGAASATGKVTNTVTGTVGHALGKPCC